MPDFSQISAFFLIIVVFFIVFSWLQTFHDESVDFSACLWRGKIY